MIFWFVLFLLVVLISFLLALSSMKDYMEGSKGLEYSLYLIRNQNLTHLTLDKLYQQLRQDNLIISLERLIKGSKSALVIFGPKKVLEKYIQELNLLELEDYTTLEADNVNIWEISLKGVNFNLKELISNLRLFSDEQFFWQVLLKPDKDRGVFQVQIRAAAVSLIQERKKQILEEFVKTEHISKVPKPFNSEQFFNFFKERVLVFDPKNPKLKSDEVLRLVK